MSVVCNVTMRGMAIARVPVGKIFQHDFGVLFFVLDIPVETDKSDAILLPLT